MSIFKRKYIGIVFPVYDDPDGDYGFIWKFRIYRVGSRYDYIQDDFTFRKRRDCKRAMRKAIRKMKGVKK